jgi:hypothetical protein
MEFSKETKTLLNGALGMAREEGFLLVGVAFNEHDNSCQFINNDGMSRHRVLAILAEAALVVGDHTRRSNQEEQPNLYKGDA